MVHIPCSYLDFKWQSLLADNSGVQGLVHIGFWRGNVVLETVGYRREHIVYQTQRVIALVNGVHNNSHRVFVVYLVYALALQKCLFVYSVNGLYASVYLGRCAEI